MMTRRTLACAFLFAVTAFAAKPMRDWKTGTLIESADEKEVAGANAMQYGQMASARVAYSTLRGYVIRGADMVWMVSLRIPPASTFRHPKQPNVTINGPVKYAFEKGKFYLQDEDGYEFELTVMKKRLMTPEDLAGKAK
jgi:hypothetical protein